LLYGIIAALILTFALKETGSAIRRRCYLLELKRTGAIASELSLASGVSISRVFVRERESLAKATPFLANARAEAVPA
jgi:hypothetical protein